MKRFIQLFFCVFLVILFAHETAENEKNSSIDDFTISAHNQAIFAANFETTNDWRLMLVNSEHPLTQEYPVTLGTVEGYSIDQRVVAELSAMLSDAKNDGYPLQLYSSYRSFDGSQAAFDRKMKDLQMSGMSYDKAFETTNRWIALPGESEHNTGLAIDIVSTDYFDSYDDLYHEFENFPQYGWLINHCADYGFILRYPKDKQDITKITFEPWHFRYVGTDHAQYIMENSICLEEYLELLKKPNKSE